MKLEVGKTYKARNGKIVKITEISGDPWYVFFGSDNHVYLRNGWFSGPATEREYDLIEEVVPPKPVEGPAVTVLKEHKVGDKVFDILSGQVFKVLHTLISMDDLKWVAIDRKCREAPFTAITTDGFHKNSHKYPRFISLAEAKAKGYDVPVQKVKKSKTLIAVYVPSLNTKMLRAESQIDLPLPPDAITKEVTFEWEEEDK